MQAWIDRNGNINHLDRMGMHEEFAMQYLNKKGIPASKETCNQQMIEAGWLRICGNGLQFSVLRGVQIFSILKWLSEQRILFIDAPNWPNSASPEYVMRRVG